MLFSIVLQTETFTRAKSRAHSTERLMKKEADKKDSLEDEEILENVASVISKFIQKDDEYPDACDILPSRSHTGGSAIDYKEQIASFVQKDSSTPMVLPQALQDCLNCIIIFLLSKISVSFLLISLDANYKVYSGLFPDLHRAYLTIDSKFFLWNYNSKYAFYPILSYLIDIVLWICFSL
jgi:hypothetical protein